MSFRKILFATLGATLLLPSTVRACSSCGCSVNSDWAGQGYSANAGFHFDVRYDYFNQDQLRSGSGRFDRASASVPNDRELQVTTINRALNLGFDYNADGDWGVQLQVPVFDRPHATIAEGDDEISRSRSRGLGDMRLIGRYQGFNDDRSLGVQFGLKLPTGRSNFEFNDGPQAGNSLDRGLQPGAGTTDLLLGIYRHGALGERLVFFTAALLQVPLNAHDRFRPGAGLNVNAGVRYLGEGGIVPQLQINVRHERRESGANADVDNSGATLVHLSPGIAWPIGRKLQAYAFVQMPLYQRVNGLQLEPHYSVSVGVRWPL